MFDRLFEEVKIVDLADKLVEKLAALEHEQWVHWAKEILELETIDKERAKKWEDLFVPYAELSEEKKEMDREWARKVLAIIEE